MSAILKRNPTVDQAAEAWTRGFAAAVRDAAGQSHRLTLKKVSEMSGPYADNAQNYFIATGKRWADVDTVIESGARYVRDKAATAAGADGRLSLAEIETLPRDLVEDVLILRGKRTVPTAPTGLPAMQAAVKASEIDAITDYGMSFDVRVLPASTARLDILREIIGYDQLTDREAKEWFDVTGAATATADFARMLRDTGAEEHKDADNEATGAAIEKRFEGVAAAAEGLFVASDFKSLELLEHSIAEDGDTELHVLLAKQKDDSWLVLTYSNFPF